MGNNWDPGNPAPNFFSEVSEDFHQKILAPWKQSLFTVSTGPEKYAASRKCCIRYYIVLPPIVDMTTLWNLNENGSHHVLFSPPSCIKKSKTKYKSWNKLTQCIFLIEKKYIGQLEQVLNEKIIIDKLNFCMNTCDFILGGSTRIHWIVNIVYYTQFSSPWMKLLENESLFELCLSHYAATSAISPT